MVPLTRQNGLDDPCPSRLPDVSRGGIDTRPRDPRVALREPNGVSGFATAGVQEMRARKQYLLLTEV